MKTRLIHRRHVLKFLGGSALGAVFSPLPWKVLDDVSIWTQNWSWIPVAAKGETVIRHTTCALCPAGCGVKVRCVGLQPVGLSGLTGHPTSRGFLCPGGLVGHHLPYLLRRLTRPVRLANRPGEAAPLTPAQAATELGRLLAGFKADPSAGRVAIIDSLPGRSTSLVYRRFASQFPGGAYIVPRNGIERSLRIFDGVAGDDYPELGVDVERARTVLSFGADLFEGWGMPGRLAKKRQSANPGPRVTQIEPRYSNTAVLADTWLPVRPGTEPVLAIGIGGVIVGERLFNQEFSRFIDQLNEIPDFRELLTALSPVRAAEACGLDPEAVTETAREMGANSPSLALVGGNSCGGPFDEDDHLAINFMNVLAGAVGSAGGLIPRRSLPEIAPPMADGLVSPSDLSEIPDESVGFLMIDATVLRQSFPSALIRRKLRRDKAVVVSFSSFADEYSDLSRYILPVPLYLEGFQELPTPPDSPVASFSFSVPLLSAPPAALTPVEWISRLAQSARLESPRLSADGLAEARIKALWGCRRGSVYSYADGMSKANADFSSAEELNKAFRSGAVWLDSPADPVKPNLAASRYLNVETWGRLKRLVNQRIEIVSRPADDSVTLMPFATALTATVSPLAGKLTRESDLYPKPADALMSSSTAGRLALKEGQRAEIETSKGRLPVRIRLDETAVPGVVFVPVSMTEDPRNLCDTSEDPVWRPTPAKLRRLDV